MMLQLHYLLLYLLVAAPIADQLQKYQPLKLFYFLNYNWQKKLNQN